MKLVNGGVNRSLLVNTRLREAVSQPFEPRGAFFGSESFHIVEPHMPAIGIISQL